MAKLTIQQAFDLGLGHHRAGRLREAEQLYRQILIQQPEHADAIHWLGVIANQAGRNDIAVGLIRRAIALNPDNADSHNNLGNALKDNGQLDEAIAAYRRAIALKANLPEAHNNLGNALTDIGQLDEAIAAYRQAIALRPNLPEAHNNLGNAFRIKGQLDEAIAAYRQAIALRPNYFEAHSTLVYTLYYHPAYDAQAIAQEHRVWNRRHAEPLRKITEPASTSSGEGQCNDPSPDRRLRIGYVSSDFRDHPVARFLLPLLECHDHRQVEVFCYSNLIRSEGITARFRSSADHWREIGRLNNDQAVAQIRADGIDILVDLSGHTAGNRLLVFARKPAPVQVSYLGYPGPTGLSAIDYRLTDRLADPADLTDPLQIETLYRLPHTNWCFLAPPEAPPVEAPPALRRGRVTFGSFNRFAKVTEAMLQAWERILQEVPGSRLLLKAAALGAASVRQRVCQNFAAQGIEASRLDLRSLQLDRAAHLALYGEMDIALDAFPYNGTITTCEALWMGAPVITLAGQTHVSRVSLSLLTNIGLPELIATTTDEYVRLAVGLAKDEDRLKMLRLNMRERMRNSPLMDAEGFARDVEAAYRQMWHTWCRGREGITNGRKDIQQTTQLAAQHHQAGRLAEAEAIYRQVVQREPNHAQALHMLGVIAHQVGQNDLALDWIGRAIAIQPSLHEAHYNLGVVLYAKGQLDEAIAAYRQAITVEPSYSAAHNNLGIALSAKGQLDEAIAAYHRAVALNPNSPRAYNSLGVALREKGQLDKAIAACRQSIALDPGHAEAHFNLGNPLKDNGQLDEAIAAYRQAIALKPNLAAAHSNLGVALKEKGQLREAIAACRHAIALEPDLAEAHNTLALILLLQGNFAEGWKEYEWRWSGSRELRSCRWKSPQPQWDGSDLTHRTIYLHAEQGLGDTIQFTRYVPLVVERGGKVVVRCQPELRRLLQQVSDAAKWIMPGEPQPAFDVHCPLLSLALAFGTTLQSIPQSVPYLKADSEGTQRWRKKLDGDRHGFKVGLAWAGYSKNTNDRNRSIPLSLLAPLSRVIGVNFYSLQKGEAGRQAKNPPDGLELMDWTEDLKDFADTAALVANLDLVISVDTAVVHLAGALGTPVWAMLPFAPDWRWQLDRGDSPWYPTLRLFRQSSLRAWDGVIRQVAESLAGLVHRG